MPGFAMKSFGQIRDSMLNWAASSQSKITDFNVGSVVRTILESFASELAEVYFRIFSALDNAQEQAVYLSFDFPKKAATASAGIVLFQKNSLPTTPINISIGAEVAAPATSSEPQVAFNNAALVILPAQTTLNGAIVSTGATSVTVTSAANIAAGDVVQVDTEKMKVSVVASNVLTVSRGYAGTTAATHLNAAPIGVVGKAVSLTCEVTGALGNVAAGAITQLNTPIAGIDSVTNEAAFSGGTDEETDDDRKKRFQEYVSGLQRGTKTAIQFGAKQVAGVVSAVAIDLDDDITILPGNVNLYVADASGTASSTLLAAVVTELNNWRPAGVRVTVAAPAIVAINLTANLKLNAGFDPTAIKAAVNQSLVNYVTSLKMGQPVYVSQLYRVIIETNPSAIVNATITVPSGDTAITPAQIARPGTITLTTS